MKNLLGIQRLRAYIAKKRGRLICILIIAIISSVLALLPAQVVAQIVDLLPTAPLHRIVHWVLLFGGIYVLSSVLSLIYGNLVMNFSNGIIEDVRKDLFRSVIFHEVKITDPDISGDVITRSTADVEQITRVIAGPLNGFLGKILVFLFSLVVLGTIDIKLIFVTLVVSGMLYFLSKRVSEKNKEYGKKERGQIGKISLAFSDILKNRFLVKSYCTEDLEIKRLKELSDGVLNCRKSAMGYMTRFWSGVEVCNCIGYVVAFLACIYEVKAGHCSVGQVVVVYSYLQSVFSTMINVSRYRTDIFNADAALGRVFSLVTKEEPSSEEDNFVNASINKVTLSDLSVKYGDKSIINGLNMEMKPGAITVLSAESGKGKSTLIQTLAGFTEISAGHIFFDQIDVTNRVCLRRKMMRVCYQVPFLQQKTIKENISYGGDETSNGCFDSLIQEIITQKENGEVLNASNNCLSGGEARRVSLARTVNRHVPIYLFDEPTAELDEENRKKVIDGIRQLSKNSIVLVATHDSDMIHAADVVIQM